MKIWKRGKGRSNCSEEWSYTENDLARKTEKTLIKSSLVIGQLSQHLNLLRPEFSRKTSTTNQDQRKLTKVFASCATNNATAESTGARICLFVVVSLSVCVCVYVCDGIAHSCGCSGKIVACSHQ